MSKTKNTLLSMLFLVVAVTYWSCEGPAGADGAGAYISVSPALVSVAKGESVSATATTKNSTDGSYTWASSDASIASVSNGTITGVSEGLAIVAVVGNESGASASVIVNVTAETRSDYDYTLDIQPMFTSDNFWFAGSDACTWCHFSNDEEEGSKHAMDLGTYAGMIMGADPVDGVGVPLFGQAANAETGFDWSHGMLRERLRNNRMPQAPAWEFRRDESNRNGPDITVNGPGDIEVVKWSYTSWDNEWADDNTTGVTNALGLVQAFVEGVIGTAANINAADENTTFSYGGVDGLTYADVQPFFTQTEMWFQNSQACVECHYSNEDVSFHAMDLNNFDGMITGADHGEGSLFNAGTNDDDVSWSSSRLRKRLRNNRMPPNSPFLLSEENRDGPDVWDPVEGEMTTAVELIGRWLDAGAPH